MENKLFLRDIDKQRLLKLLADYLPEVNAWAYGSRVNGQAHDTSDSNIPILVEARDWARLPESFYQEILRNYVDLKGL